MSQSRFTTRQMATAGIIAAVYGRADLLLPIPQYANPVPGGGGHDCAALLFPRRRFPVWR